MAQQPPPLVPNSTPKSTTTQGFGVPPYSPPTDAAQTSPLSPTPNAFAAPPPPLNQQPGVSMSQGTDFSPENYEKDNNLPPSDPFSDIDDVLSEEDGVKKPLNIKMLAIIGGSVFAIIAVIIVIIAVIANSSSSTTSDEPFLPEEDVPAVSEEEIDWGNLEVSTPEESSSEAVSSEESTSSSEEVSSSSEEAVVEYEVTYDEETLDALRAVGYTAPELEKFQIDGEEDTDGLINKQKKAIRKAMTVEYKTMIEALQNSAGEESAAFFADTWYGYPIQALRENVKDDLGMGESPERSSYTENVDYVKIPLYGNQVWLKVTLSNEDVIFMPVSPQRYQDLEKDTGNIVVNYTRVKWLDGVFYENISEKKVN